MENRDINKNPYKIMIVDDDPLVVKTLERLLYTRNYLFFSVYSGEEALSSVLEINPDIILLDVFMQGLTGYEVCKELSDKGITENIPVIFLTSSNQKSEIIKGFKAGAVDFIVKPFNTEELIARLQTHLELKKAREEIKAINLVKSKFFSIITKDIKDSLTGVKGVSKFLHDEINSENCDQRQLKKLSEILLADSSLLYQYVENLIRWDQIEKTTDLEIQNDIKLRELIDIILKDYEVAIKEKDITVYVSPDANFFLSSNIIALNEILREIIHNAIKYCYPSGYITIKADNTNKVNTIEIENTGAGLDKEVIENIFRLDTPHPKTIGTKQEKGIGLGLILCNAWTKKLGGEISIKSEKLKNLTVVLQLPDLQSSNKK